MPTGQSSMEARAAPDDGDGVSNDAFWEQFFLDDSSHAPADPTAGYAASLDGGVEARRFDDGSAREAPPAAVSSGDDQLLKLTLLRTASPSTRRDDVRERDRRH